MEFLVRILDQKTRLHALRAQAAPRYGTFFMAGEFCSRATAAAILPLTKIVASLGRGRSLKPRDKIFIRCRVIINDGSAISPSGNERRAADP